MQLFATACHKSCQVHGTSKTCVTGEKSVQGCGIQSWLRMPCSGHSQNFQSTLVLFYLETLNATEQFWLLDLQSQHGYFRVKCRIGCPVLCAGVQHEILPRAAQK